MASARHFTMLQFNPRSSRPLPFLPVLCLTVITKPPANHQTTNPQLKAKPSCCTIPFILTNTTPILTTIKVSIAIHQFNITDSQCPASSTALKLPKAVVRSRSTHTSTAGASLYPCLSLCYATATVFLHRLSHITTVTEAVDLPKSASNQNHWILIIISSFVDS